MTSPGSVTHCLQAVPRRGEEPEHDAQEKTLLKTATRGVVRLFNAVSKAQRDQKDALVGGSRSRVRPSLDQEKLLTGLLCTATLKFAFIDVLSGLVCTATLKLAFIDVLSGLVCTATLKLAFIDVLSFAAMVLPV